MAGEPNEQAETLAEVVVNDGIIDLDAPPQEGDAASTNDEEEGEKPEGESEEAGEKDAGEEEKPKKPSGSERAKIRQQRLLSEIAARDREIEELRSRAPAEKAGEGDEKPPREKDFNGDWFAWQRAMTAFEAGKAVRDEIRKDRDTRQKTERETKQAEIARERSIAHMERVEDAREVIADFDKIMKGMDGVQVRNEVIEEIMSSDKSALLAYHLAKNPDKLSAMNQMSGRELAREMGRLEATVRLPEAKKQTTAPPPMSRPKGGASPSSAESDLNTWLKKTYG